MFDPRDPDASLVVLFKNLPIKHDAKSLEAGRPIFEDREHIEIRVPGNRGYVGVYPATEFCGWVTDPFTGEQRSRTYAERFAKQYRQFREQKSQTVTGTPLEHLPFLTEARRAELRALGVYVAEQLAQIDGQELKNLGPGGRDAKNKAIEFLEQAKTMAPNNILAAEVEAQRIRIQLLEEDKEALKAKLAQAGGGNGEFADMSVEQLREYIKAQTGHEPLGSLNQKTLVRMANDVRPNKVA